jgi:hypothetical protein
MENEETKRLQGQQWWKGSLEKETSPKLRRKTLIGDEPSVGSTNRRHRGEAFNETNAAALSDSVDDARIESNCSPELEPSRTSVSHFGSFGSRLGMGFRISERAR